MAGQLNNVNGILVDTTLCIGCYACEDACAQRWGNPSIEAHELSEKKITAVKKYADAANNDVFVPRMCMHCSDPACASVCPVGALEKTTKGGVVYDAKKCMGCRYCMMACPFEVPKYQWLNTMPQVTKCDMCTPRTEQGQLPACVEACPVEPIKARTFGKRADLLQEAHRRIKEGSGAYIDHIYGENEIGGTSTMYLSKLPFDNIGFRTDLPSGPLPKYTYDVLSKIPNYVFWGSTLLGGIWWITNRRKEVALMERKLEEMEQQKPSDRILEKK
jgi:formate dehydrogenase iron-sulfur subunit